MWVSGLPIRCTVSELLPGRMADVTRATIRMTKRRASEPSSGQISAFMKADGRTESKMDSDFTRFLLINLAVKGNGKKESALSGLTSSLSPSSLNRGSLNNNKRIYCD
jgi:hypothetical protein